MPTERRLRGMVTVFCRESLARRMQPLAQP
jgi:hypothetical protein